MCLGTQNEGVWVSHDGGSEWLRSRLDLPPYARAGEVDVRAVAVSPHNPRQVWAGSTGEPGRAVLLRSDDCGRSFENVPAPLDGSEIWSIALSPHDASVILVGLRPAGVLRSTDGGQSWKELALGAAQLCNAGSSRTTDVAIDPDHADEIWASVEIDGVFHSDDGGDNWARIVLNNGQSLLGPTEVWRDDRHEDIHGVEVGGGAVCASTPIGFFRSTDQGRTWSPSRFPEPVPGAGQIWYTRGLLTKTDDPDTILAGVGDYIPGARGVIQRSTDGGRSWAPVSQVTNSVVYAIAGHRDIPETMAACSIFGQVLTSTDGGATWSRTARDFGETRAIAISPASG
ncbi:photosystem II stability/assembly factor-like uncharacterized protein [Pseudonocardia eucalypti]|nr:photosystem II stability/assembly factor-like uncharacterized protein [Pseudonocardia eucalypti]